MPGLYYEELTEGRVFQHAIRRTITAGVWSIARSPSAW